MKSKRKINLLVYQFISEILLILGAISLANNIKTDISLGFTFLIIFFAVVIKLIIEIKDY